MRNLFCFILLLVVIAIAGCRTGHPAVPETWDPEPPPVQLPVQQVQSAEATETPTAQTTEELKQQALPPVPPSPKSALDAKLAPTESQTGRTTPSTVGVTISGFKFVPQVVHIKVGSAVKWINDDAVPHTVTSSDFDSGLMKKGQSWSYTFSKSGSYDYICTPHPWMKGKIIVE